ncbi:hypothetical protein [Arcobacter cloacae]|uniref:Uncharacterized protein n=1 Tax=Arcobacter cloacae TaxID=1054034 RepID=A0A4Q0ZM64_9BACT|nr:hypothetical protein [Arcobacter cloacae]RXJ84756.1 hypothetical protein CRU90_05210 [Arcobacter cloacae]
MYISEELLKKEYDNPKIKLKDMLENVLTEKYNDYLDRKLNITKMLETIGILNTFCKNNNFELIKISHTDPNKASHCYNMLQNYQSEFLVENTDLYTNYFPSFKYEFKPEKLEEIKSLVKSIKQDIISNHSEAENKEIIIELIDEMENDLKLKTNSLNNIKGKLILLHAQVTVLGVDTDELKSKIKSVYKMLFEADTFINTVISLKNHISDFFLSNS